MTLICLDLFAAMWYITLLLYEITRIPGEWKFRTATNSILKVMLGIEAAVFLLLFLLFLLENLL